MNEALVWIVDDDRSIRWVLERALLQAGIAAKAFSSGEALERQLGVEQPDAIISDIRMPGMDGFELLERIKQHDPELPVVIMTAHSDLDSAVTSFQSGAFEYLPKPFDIDEAVAVVRRALSYAQEHRKPVSEVHSEAPEIIGSAPAMQEVFRAIGRLAKSNITVLINGQSGTGKELVARALHRHSPRAEAPFIALNMAAIPRELIESELFGHEKGAFTGAAQQRLGRFEQADGGTLFLDEIGDMPSETQTRLLRVLADGEFYRVGGHVPVRTDVRIITATHQNLEALVRDHRFREDLYHRLNVIRIHLPRLADRKTDIPALARFFLLQSAKELGVEPKSLSPETEKHLCGLPWPGNVRQLENTCRWLTVMASGREVQPIDLPPELHSEPLAADTGISWEASLRGEVDQLLARGERSILDNLLPRFEHTVIEAALDYTNGKRSEAADLLGWGRNTVTRKIKELEIEPDQAALSPKR